MGKIKKQNSMLCSKLNWLGLFVICLLLISSMKCFADDTRLSKITGAEIAYAESFLSFDKCGDYELGGRIREALVAKIESCPFTEEAKLKFYKHAALSGSQAVPEIMSTVSNNEHCKSPQFLSNAKLLQDKFSEFDAGKIKLEDVIVDFKKSGKPLSCVDISKLGPNDVQGEGVVKSHP